MAASYQNLRVVNVGQRRNSITSETEDSGYDMLSDITGTSDDDASTDSLSGSLIDESEGRLASQFKYDLQDTDSEDDEVYSGIEAGCHDGPSMPTPSVGPCPDDHESLEDKALSSSLSVLTERPPRTDQSIVLEEIEKKTATESYSDIWNKITSTDSFDKAVQAINSPTGKMVLGLFGSVAIAVLTSSMLSPLFNQTNSTQLVQPLLQHKEIPVAKVQPSNVPIQAEAKGWPQFEQYQQTLKYLKDLTSSQSSNQLSSLDSSTLTIKSASTVPRSTSSPTKIAKSYIPFSKKTNRTQPKILEKPRYVEKEKFYVYLNTGRVTPFNVGHKLKHKHRFGPFTQITGDEKKFKINFDAVERKIKVAYIGGARSQGSTRIVVSREGKVLQRGQLNSADTSITWFPSTIKTDDAFGQLQILFALPTEAVFQVSVLDLGESSTSSYKAKDAAKDVMRRITDAISVYVAPHRHVMSQIPVWKPETDIKTALAPVMSPVTDVILRAQNQAVAIAQSFRAVALMDLEAANRCLGQANINLVKAFGKYRGEVIRAARGAPRQTLSKAQDRVKELKKTMEKKFADSKAVGDKEPMRNVKTEPTMEKRKPVSAWGVLGL